MIKIKNSKIDLIENEKLVYTNLADATVFDVRFKASERIDNIVWKTMKFIELIWYN